MQLEELIYIAKTINEKGLKGNKRDNFLRDKYNMSARTWQKKIKDTPIKYNNATKKYDINIESNSKVTQNKHQNDLECKIKTQHKETLKAPKSNYDETLNRYQSNPKDKLESNTKETINKLEGNSKVALNDLDNKGSEFIEIKEIEKVLPKSPKVTTPLVLEEFQNMKSDIEMIKDQINLLFEKYTEDEIRKENIIEVPKIDLENYDLQGEIGSRSFKTYKYVLDKFKDFCKKRNESQKDLIAIALLEFIQKYNR
ncbi:hypothetical protein [Clostridium botulinum]|uniref:hypothetical protein n=1 Tax=Clostridium botulinum TaxID=1491 RepID=UPI000773E6D9|nr:hypothetical protein [Clostridium botulinum]AUN05182.1 hypothetical protein RSJ19_20260 [Clostridium botulinum]MBN3399696.1 hypothetical protein [Clostridium botulinum]MBN3414589.1 hypothetical protein [Clostridium botulinum]